MHTLKDITINFISTTFRQNQEMIFEPKPIITLKRKLPNYCTCFILVQIPTDISSSCSLEFNCCMKPIAAKINKNNDQLVI